MYIQTTVTVVIFFVLSWWIINEFENVSETLLFSGLNHNHDLYFLIMFYKLIRYHSVYPTPQSPTLDAWKWSTQESGVTLADIAGIKRMAALFAGSWDTEMYWRFYLNVAPF